MERVMNWLEGIEIELTQDKTKAILFSQTKKPEIMKVMILGGTVQVSRITCRQKMEIWRPRGNIS